MGIAIIIILIIIDSLISIRGIVKKELLTPYTIFGLVWAFIFIVYLFSYNTWYKISMETVTVFFIGNMVFLFSSFISTNSISRMPQNVLLKDKEKASGDLNDITINNKILFIILMIISFISLTEIAITNLNYIRSGLSFNEIDINNIINSSSAFNKMISVLFVTPFMYAICPILALETICGKRRTWVILSIVTLIVINIFYYHKRAILIYLIVSFIVIILFNKSNTKISLNQPQKSIRGRIITLTLFGACLAGIIWISHMRGTSILSSFNAYFSGCIPSFDVRIKNINQHYYGLAFLHGILAPIMIGFKGIFGIEYPVLWTKLNMLIESADYVQVGPNAVLNAFNSLYYASYIDGGLIGIIIEMGIYGFIAGKLYKRAYMRGSSKDIYYYAIIVIGLVCSMFTLYFTQYPYVLSFILIYFLCRKPKHKVKL
jgi:oligosaccharide repeat unit polymerase